MKEEENTIIADPDEPKDDKRAAKASLDADEILVAEFEYIAQSAFQSNEDRARVSTYYVVTFGTLVAALFSLQVGSENLPNIHRALIVVFMTLALFGVSTMLQLVQLRIAWRSCAIAMNQIKEYYIKELKPLNLDRALVWRMNTVPPAYKEYSVAYLLALQVALLGGVSMGASFYFVGVIITEKYPSTWLPWILALGAGILYFGIMIGHYKKRLEEGQAKQIISEESETAD